MVKKEVSDVIIKECVYPHPIEKVWAAISDPEEMKHWFVSGDFKAEAGYAFDIGEGEFRVRGIILNALPPRYLEYTWIKGRSNVETTVLWTLSPELEGTRLRIEHKGVSKYEESLPALLQATREGWDYVVSAIEGYLAKTQ